MRWQPQVVLVNCGSFNPITRMHLRMFEICRDFVMAQPGVERVIGVISPVNDAYKKPDLADAAHRIAMCEIAAKNMDWIQVSRWEAEQPAYVKTVNVLQHFRSIYQNSSILLVSGADLVQSFCTPNVWAPQDISHIIKDFGLVCLARPGYGDVVYKLAGSEEMVELIPLIHWIDDNQSDISSTLIRQQVRAHASLDGLTYPDIESYIRTHNLYA